MLRLKLDGYSYNHIGELAGISRQRVQQLLSPPIAVRRIIVKAYNGHCAACDIYVGYGGHVHHKGHEEETYNQIEQLELLCPTCHRAKHPSPLNHEPPPTVPVDLPRFNCKRCGHAWTPRGGEIRQCPKCKTAYWDTPKGNNSPKTDPKTTSPVTDRKTAPENFVEKPTGGITGSRP